MQLWSIFRLLGQSQLILSKIGAPQLALYTEKPSSHNKHRFLPSTAFGQTVHEISRYLEAVRLTHVYQLPSTLFENRNSKLSVHPLLVKDGFCRANKRSKTYLHPLFPVGELSSTPLLLALYFFRKNKHQVLLERTQCNFPNWEHTSEQT